MAKRAVGAILVALLIAPPSIHAQSTTTPFLIHVEDACEGSGFFMKLSEGTTKVYIESCGDSHGLHSRVWRDAGDISDYNAQPNATEFIYLIHGTEVTENGTLQEWISFMDVLSTPEARLATRAPSVLVKLGFDPESLSMIALTANLTGFEVPPPEPEPPVYPLCDAISCRSTSTECLGCCGDGCDGGCFVCTSACEAHDRCVRENRQTGCMALFLAAVASIGACLASGRATCC